MLIRNPDFNPDLNLKFGFIFGLATIRKCVLKLNKVNLTEF
jgi:hypothetical protein